MRFRVGLGEEEPWTVLRLPIFMAHLMDPRLLHCWRWLGQDGKEVKCPRPNTTRDGVARNKNTARPHRMELFAVLTPTPPLYTTP